MRFVFTQCSMATFCYSVCLFFDFYFCLLSLVTHSRRDSAKSNQKFPKIVNFNLQNQLMKWYWKEKEILNRYELDFNQFWQSDFLHKNAPIVNISEIHSMQIVDRQKNINFLTDSSQTIDGFCSPQKSVFVNFICFRTKFSGSVKIYWATLRCELFLSLEFDKMLARSKLFGCFIECWWKLRFMCCCADDSIVTVCRMPSKTVWLYFLLLRCFEYEQ